MICTTYFFKPPHIAHKLYITRISEYFNSYLLCLHKGKANRLHASRLCSAAPPPKKTTKNPYNIIYIIETGFIL